MKKDNDKVFIKIGKQAARAQEFIKQIKSITTMEIPECPLIVIPAMKAVAMKAAYTQYQLDMLDIAADTGKTKKGEMILPLNDQLAMDELLFGFSVKEVDEDGATRRIDPTKVTIKQMKKE